MSASDELVDTMRAAIETALRQALDRGQLPELASLYQMLTYHLGWEGEGAGPSAQGKRIRPLLVTLTSAAAGSDWRPALPAAAAVELVHNFSLIHDDIEDNSPLRRGRATLWKLWGVPLAINAGDALFTLAHLSILDLVHFHPPSTVLEATGVLHQTCLQLTHGQHLDLSYQTQADLPVEAYWPMVSGKTAALLAACTELGAIVAGARGPLRGAYHDFGNHLGLAFQAQDDLLGIWGDQDRMGKSADSDLIEGKKSLPVLYGLAQGGAFAQRWARGPIQPDEAREIAELLADEGAYDYTQQWVVQLTQSALAALATASPQGQAGQALEDLTNRLLARTS